MDYTVVTKATEEGVSAWVPGLPGCWSEGATEDEALENIQEAVADYLAVEAEPSLREAGTKAHTVTVAPQIDLADEISERYKSALRRLAD